MQVILSPEQEQFVRQKVESGHYNSASEVVREAFLLLRERDEVERLRLEELRKEVAIGLEQLDRGEGAPLDMEAIKARAYQRLRVERGEDS